MARIKRVVSNHCVRGDKLFRDLEGVLWFSPVVVQTRNDKHRLA
ncbi:hypothetical protein [Sinorhizobium meliloti]|nr:hypothetical protein [Sinorhizobium meliloti]